MKKILLVTTILAMGLNANAQFAIHGGYANVWEKTSAFVSKTQSLYGLYLGGSYNYNFSSSFGLEAGLRAMLATAKPVFPKSYKGYARMKYLTLAVPIDANYSLSVNDDLSVVVLIGPVFDFGLLYRFAGYDRYDADNLDPNGVTSKRFNLYAEWGTRLKYKQIGLDIVYQYGLLKVADNGVTSVRHNRIAAGMTYSF